MEDTNAEGRLAAARERLVEIWADHQIRAIARKYADRPQDAEDALQATYLAMYRLPYLDRIDNMRAYFCRVLIRAVYHDQRQLGALLVEDFALVTEASEAGTSDLRLPQEGVEDAACASVQAQHWHRRLTQDRGKLTAGVPSRSDDPARYQRMVYDAAEQILQAGISGEPSEADSNDAFRAACPDYFDAPGTAKNTSHQRFSRARADVRDLLQEVTC
jgi:DNA-directed RNA polymerase specialized sigma24 family protein